jgi:glycosyltransferase involved in cell wall biosynthesis
MKLILVWTKIGKNCNFYLRKIRYNYRLIIVGQSNKKENKKFNSMIKNRNFENIFYLGFIPRNEWRYLLNQAKISVSAFAKNSVNNKYCASGKLYESLFEGTPVLTSDNPPLKRLCNNYNIGISTVDFTKGILELEKKYDFYCNNVKLFIKNLIVEERLNALVELIKEEIKSSNKFKLSQIGII